MLSLRAVVLLGAACSVNTTPPAGTALRCGADGACPPGTTCELPDRICRAPAPLGPVSLAGVRVLPLAPRPGEPLLAWPVALSPRDGSVSVSVRWSDGRGVLLQEGAALGLTIDGGLSAGTEVIAELTARDADGRTVRHVSCLRRALDVAPEWRADRPARGTFPPSEPGAPPEAPPRVVLDVAQHRLMLLGPELWELDLERDGTLPGVGSPGKDFLRWRRLRPTGAPPAVYEAPAVLAPSGDALVSFGGATPTVASFARGCEAFTALVPSGVSPLPFGDGVAIVTDAKRDRVVAIGGVPEGGGAATSLVALRLAAGTTPSWEPLDARLASGRFGHAALIDPIADRLIVLGGATCAAPCSSPVLVDAATIHAVALADVDGGGAAFGSVAVAGDAPTSLFRAAVVVDPRGHRALVWGGCVSAACTSYRAELWSLDLAAGAQRWSRLTPAGETPPPGPATLLYDPHAHALVVVALPTHGSHAVRTLSLSRADAAWEDVDPHPGPRAGHGGALARGGELVVFGGHVGETFADERLWRFDGAHWNARRPNGGPGPRNFVGMGRAQDGRIYLHGGETATDDRPGDLFVVPEDEVAAWMPANVVGVTPGRAAHSPALIVGSVRSDAPLLRFFSGQPPSAEPRAEGFDLIGGDAGLTWSAHAGPFPEPRRFHATVFDPSPGRERVLVIGGDDGARDFADLWSSRLEGAVAWTREEVVPALPGLSAHAAVSIGPGRILLYGGRSLEGQMLLLCGQATGTPRWRTRDVTPTTAVRPCGTEQPVVAYDATTDTLTLHGGGADRHCTQVWRLSPASSLVCP